MRGCEIEGMLDAQGKVIEEGPEPRPDLKGDTRAYRYIYSLCTIANAKATSRANVYCCSHQERETSKKKFAFVLAIAQCE